MRDRDRIGTAAKSAILARSNQASEERWLKRAYEMSASSYSNIVASLGLAELDRHQKILMKMMDTNQNPDLHSLISVKLEALTNARIQWVLLGKIEGRPAATQSTPQRYRVRPTSREIMDRVEWVKQELEGGVPSVAALKALWEGGNLSVNNREVSNIPQWETVVRNVDREMEKKNSTGITRPVTAKSLLADVRLVLGGGSETLNSDT